VDTPASSSTTQAWTRPNAMSEAEFRIFGEFIQSRLGIRMPRNKKGMLESRLVKRLRSLGLSSYKKYREYLFSPEGMEAELSHLIDAVTTNKTEFFREEQHFEILAKEILPGWTEGASSGRISLWSAGCSTGEEIYTAGMVLADSLANRPGWDFELLGTDISREVLQTAARAVYTEDRVERVPPLWRRKYLMRSKDRSKQQVRIVPELRARASFGQLNLMEDFSLAEKVDLIFCRNVIIYFEKPVQERILGKLTQCLRRGGYLFIGHSESLSGTRLPLRQYSPTVYRKVG
jgi:chemotaxis protein methyltransferase CheR